MTSIESREHGWWRIKQGTIPSALVPFSFLPLLFFDSTHPEFPETEFPAVFGGDEDIEGWTFENGHAENAIIFAPDADSPAGR